MFEWKVPEGSQFIEVVEYLGESPGREVRVLDKDGSLHVWWEPMEVEEVNE